MVGNTCARQESRIEIVIYLIVLSMVGISHLATAVSAFATGIGAVLQTSDLIAALGAGLANSGANGSNIFMK